MSINILIKGIPYGQPSHRRRGDVKAPQKWSEAIKNQTAHLMKVSKPCTLKVEFILPDDKHPTDRPFGNDLDNLLKPFLDALQPIPLEDDSYVMKLVASKRRVEIGETPGAQLSIEEIQP